MTPQKSARALLTEGTAILRMAGMGEPARDARRLMAHALGVAPGRLTLAERDPVPAAAERAYRRAIDARAAHQPVSQIVGGRWFYGHFFEVTPDVLDPRPETETLVEIALAEPFSKVLDLGTGTGAILLSLLAARPAARGVGVDISDAALAVAERNARATGVAGRCGFLRSDWLRAVDGRYDLIVANPPYIAAAEMAGLAPEVRDHEPRIALTDGRDGLVAYRAIAAGVAGHLTPGGRLIVETGATQARAVSDIFRAAGLEKTEIHPDLSGKDRVVAARAQMG